MPDAGESSQSGTPETPSESRHGESTQTTSVADVPGASTFPTSQSSTLPSLQPSTIPSSQPSTIPSSQPSTIPSSPPSTIPSLHPSTIPRSHPSTIPSTPGSTFASSQASTSCQPSAVPSSQSSSLPSSQASPLPSSRQCILPSSQPSTFPSFQPSSLPGPQPSQIRQATCTPLNTPSHLYGATPLNTAVSSALNVPTTQRIPILFGFVSPMETNTLQSTQALGTAARIPGEGNNAGGPLNSAPMPPQDGNLSSMSAQELQQVVISRMLASENAESAFLPPNVSGVPANPPPRAPVLLPHVHSLLNPPGVTSGVGEVTVWPFSPNSSMFQQ